MAEESTPAEGAEEAAAAKAAADEGKGPKDDDVAAIAAKADNPDAVASALRSERAIAREARKKADAAEAKVKEYEDRDKTAQEKADQKAADAESRAKTAETKLLRTEVAAAKKLPAGFASRLQGETKEELEADADKLLEDLKPGSSTNWDGGPRSPAPTPGDMDSAIRKAAGF